MRLLAIDPGNRESAWLVYDVDHGRVVEWAKEPNRDVLQRLEARMGCDRAAIEMIASYGMAVGADVFETCVWIGRFVERWQRRCAPEATLVYRLEVKSCLCHSGKAKDANVRQALIDLYGGTKEAAIGRKAAPGPLYGLSGDGWAALGVAVTAAAKLA